MASIHPDRHYVRHLQTVVVSVGDSFLFSRGDERAAVDGVEAPAFSRLMQALAVPMPGRELLDRAFDHEPLLGELVDKGLVLEAADADTLIAARSESFGVVPGYSFVPGPTRCDRLVLGLTGSIVAGLMAPFIVSLAYMRFHRELDLVITPSAASFVEPELFEYYGIRTWTDEFSRRTGTPVPHMVLGKEADLVLIMPASARTLGRLARGECSDLLSLIVAATDGPVVVAPCTNTAIWDHPPVRRNVDRIRADECYVIEPTLFFEAAELIHGSQPGYGMVGPFWGGPVSLVEALGLVLDHRS